jgi:3-phosphoshikimate 1-carboxyvinyltransferase
MNSSSLLPEEPTETPKDRKPREVLLIPPLKRAQGTVRLPGSKSISNRVLLLAALADGLTDISYLRQLGVQIWHDGHITAVDGCAGEFTARSAEIFLGNAGTAIRPLTAALALLGGDYRVYGVPRMHERPIGDLVDALINIGCSLQYEQKLGYPPLLIGQPSLRLDKPVGVRGDVSSQFLTALLLALPLAAVRLERDVEVQMISELISKPYVEITLNLMARFGVVVQRTDWSRFVIPAGSAYRSPGGIIVEGDASSASYFLAAATLGGGPLLVRGAGRLSIQGDVHFATVLAQMGAQVDWQDDAITVTGLQPGVPKLRGGTIDCLAIPDAAMTLAVLGLFCDAPLTLTGIASWKVKETDRIAAMQTELRKLGATVDSSNDSITVHPCGQLREAEIETYDDHRMAMCFSLAAFGGSGVRIIDPDCTAKTYPEYFTEFMRLTD